MFISLKLLLLTVMITIKLISHPYIVRPKDKVCIPFNLFRKTETKHLDNSDRLYAAKVLITDSKNPMILFFSPYFIFTTKIEDAKLAFEVVVKAGYQNFKLVIDSINKELPEYKISYGL